MDDARRELFERFLTDRNDKIYNLAYQLLCTLADPDYEYGDEPIEWDMEKIGAVADSAEIILEPFTACFPYYSEEEDGSEDIPCAFTKDCGREKCPFDEYTGREKRGVCKMVTDFLKGV